MGVKGFSFLESLQWEKIGVMGQKEGTERPGCRRDYGILAGNVDGVQVNHSQRFGLYARAVGWVLWMLFCKRGMGSDVCFGKLALPLSGGWMGEGMQGG